ncbi:plastin-1-like [Paramacrobiotus metropolitanus]|uniref:plastin-1-like n=1 Tax=Paramacrobiotus metropolitanus TaxID=2943436 RepID=UPI002445FCDE|nr:plastin-1-like [Paramacrobiotus metropolitanus]XP_055333676.1 plastin-1-like [Paramacrobiotus metropolitanus]XP_055333677.1 plastin-1-like [Paramacrobiotus metropolitanus]XP_055333678.1 plastin-1-like [Paramacrobiotus metropolitanus]XP_055333679.1 plastin-1-like [Paramacrobiotus metropolitanus]XP_055333680.1 plastin-1-like [Paramacrobiotus metropolitanus]XP_055333681.1 plastin-1-like [Paramacrobiotus metropolitanus]
MAGIGNRQSFLLTQEQILELSEQFDSIDENGNGYIEAAELKNALDAVGFKIPQWEVRKMIEDFDKNSKQPVGKGKLSFQEFQDLCSKLKSMEVSTTFKKMVNKRENLKTHGGMSQASVEGTTHSIRVEEQLAFSDWINSNLSNDPDLKHILPIDAEGIGLYSSVRDGILLCKTINLACPDTIDERVMNKKNLNTYTRHENLTLALNSAESIGCNIVNIDADDLSKGKPHLVLGLLWQIIRIGLFNQITIEHCPGLVLLLNDDEKIEDLLRMAPETILLRWVNYHLKNAGVDRRISNFTTDIKDSFIYTHLLNQIAPKDSSVDLRPLQENDAHRRAELMLKNAGKINCRAFLTANDVVEGIYKLNLAFVANLFNTHPALDKPVDRPMEDIASFEETREEKTYRNWMNSMGVNPYVNYLYGDLSSGLIIFQLYDIIKPGIVNWKKVIKTFNKMRGFIEKVENCNYAVDLGRQLNFSLVGIAGQDISDGNPTLTLALVWQLMRAYTLSILTKLARSGNPIVEKEIVQWVNKKLVSAGKTSSIQSFQDSSVSDAKVVIDLIDAIKPGSINYSQLQAASTKEEKLANAKYAISMARKIGARIYALPEDIVEVKPKMIMTVFACLMARDYIPDMGTVPGKEANGNGHHLDEEDISPTGTMDSGKHGRN